MKKISHAAFELMELLFLGELTLYISDSQLLSAPFLHSTSTLSQSSKTSWHIYILIRPWSLKSRERWRWRRLWCSQQLIHILTFMSCFLWPHVFLRMRRITQLFELIWWPSTDLWCLVLFIFLSALHDDIVARHWLLVYRWERLLQ